MVFDVYLGGSIYFRWPALRRGSGHAQCSGPPWHPPWTRPGSAWHHCSTKKSKNFVKNIIKNFNVEPKFFEEPEPRDRVKNPFLKMMGMGNDDFLSSALVGPISGFILLYCMYPVRGGKNISSRARAIFSLSEPDQFLGTGVRAGAIINPDPNALPLPCPSWRISGPPSSLDSFHHPPASPSRPPSDWCSPQSVLHRYGYTVYKNYINYSWEGKDWIEYYAIWKEIRFFLK